ncbi:MAG: hypothetical protein IPK19_04920 [Chloroflexi bacterium]|nr:hypothetical protein [Chloroflexota bacterium]
MRFSTGYRLRIGAVVFALVLLGVSALVAPARAQVVDTPLPVITLTPLPAEDVAEDISEGVVDFTVDTAQGAASFFDDLIARLTITPKSDLARILLLIGGLVLLVIGWRVYDFVVVIAGFLIGALLASSLVSSDNAIIAIAAVLIGGLLGAAVGYFLYYAAVFIIGMYIGILLTNALAISLSLAPISPLVLLIGGLIGGIILIALSFELLVLLSALVGAQMITLALSLSVIWTLVLTVVGVIIQLAMIRAFRYEFRRRRRRIDLGRRAPI